MNKENKRLFIEFNVEKNGFMVIFMDFYTY